MSNDHAQAAAIDCPRCNSPARCTHQGVETDQFECTQGHKFGIRRPRTRPDDERDEGGGEGP